MESDKLMNAVKDNEDEFAVLLTQFEGEFLENDETAAGFDEADSTETSGAKPDDFQPLFVAPVDFSVGTLAHMIGKQIDLNPEFQRRGV